MKTQVISANGLRIIAIGVLTAIMAACGDDTQTTTVTPPPTGAQPGGAPEITISIDAGASGRTDDAFGANPMNVARGTKVTWVNNDTIPHTTTSDTGVWDSGPIQPGASFSYQFNDPGTFPYFCAIHPNMRGSIEVADGAGASPTPAPVPVPVPVPVPTGSPSPSPSASPSGMPSTMSVTIAPGASTRTTDAFGTNPLTISMGTTVTWINNDSIAHTVTADDGSFDSGNIAPGGTFSHTFDDMGTFSYHCSIHPGMVGSVMVQ